MTIKDLSFGFDSNSPHSCVPAPGPAAAAWRSASPEEKETLAHLNPVGRRRLKPQRERVVILHLREVHGVPGPVVHQLVEVVSEGSFPLLGGRQALGAPLALG